jgi:hypothetical protein
VHIETYFVVVHSVSLLCLGTWRVVFPATGTVANTPDLRQYRGGEDSGGHVL